MQPNSSRPSLPSTSTEETINQQIDDLYHSITRQAGRRTRNLLIFLAFLVAILAYSSIAFFGSSSDTTSSGGTPETSNAYIFGLYLLVLLPFVVIISINYRNQKQLSASYRKFNKIIYGHLSWGLIVLLAIDILKNLGTALDPLGGLYGEVPDRSGSLWRSAINSVLIHRLYAGIKSGKYVEGLYQEIDKCYEQLDNLKPPAAMQSSELAATEPPQASSTQNTAV